jgi:hypothetical protein
MPLEWWETAKTVCEWTGVILLLLSFLSGFGALFASRKIDTAQKARLGQFDQDLTTAKTELAKQQQRAAQAESELSELQTYQQPRQLTKEQFDAIQTLRGRYSAINVAFDSAEDSEMFATEIAVALKAAGIQSTIFRRADPSHSTGGIMLYDPHAFANPEGPPTGGEPLLSALKSVGLFGGAMLSGMPIDIPAPVEIPMLIVSGRPFPKGTPSPYLGPPNAPK